MNRTASADLNPTVRGIRDMFAYAVQAHDERAYHAAVRFADRVLGNGVLASPSDLPQVEEWRRCAANRLGLPNALQGHYSKGGQELQALREETARIAFLWNGCRKGVGQSVPAKVKSVLIQIRAAQTPAELRDAEQRVNRLVGWGYLYRRGDTLKEIRTLIDTRRTALQAVARQAVAERDARVAQSASLPLMSAWR